MRHLLTLLVPKQTELEEAQSAAVKGQAVGASGAASRAASGGAASGAMVADVEWEAKCRQLMSSLVFVFPFTY